MEHIYLINKLRVAHFTWSSNFKTKSQSSDGFFIHSIRQMGRDGFGKDLSSLLLFSVVDLALDSLSTRFTSHDDLRGRWQMCTWSVLSNSPGNLRQRSLTISLTKIRVEVRKIFEKRYIWQIFSNQPISIWHHVNFLCKSMILAEKDLYFYEENMN